MSHDSTRLPPTPLTHAHCGIDVLLHLALYIWIVSVARSVALRTSKCTDWR